MESPFSIEVAILQMDVLALRDQVLDRLDILLRRLDGDAALVLVVAAEADRAGDLGDDRRFLRTTRLEQLRHPRQTAGDVAGLGALGRDTGDDVAGLHLRALVDRQNGVDRQRIAGVATAGQLEDLAVLVLDHDRRTQVGSTLGRAPIGHHALGDAGRSRRCVSATDWPSTRSSQLGETVDLGDDRTGIRIPLRHTLAALDLVALVDAQTARRTADDASPARCRRDRRPRA